MNFNLIKFFKTDYLFDLRPAVHFETIRTLLFFFGLLLIIALILKFYQLVKPGNKFVHRLMSKYFSWLVVSGLSGLLLVWWRYEQIYFLAARFWLIIWPAGFLVWLFFILKFQWRVVPKIKRNQQKKQTFEKYLPKKK